MTPRPRKLTLCFIDSPVFQGELQGSGRRPGETGSGQPGGEFRCRFQVERCAANTGVDGDQKRDMPAGAFKLDLEVNKGARADLGRPKSTPIENRDALMKRIGL